VEETDGDSRSVWDIFAESRKRVPPEEFAKLAPAPPTMPTPRTPMPRRA
jgi:hypothetical protein